MLTECFEYLATLQLVVLCALIQKGEDLEASWLTAQSSNLWRMAGPFNFRAMHCYPNHIQRAPTITNSMKFITNCTGKFEQNATFQFPILNVKGASSSNLKIITMNTKSFQEIKLKCVIFR